MYYFVVRKSTVSQLFKFDRKLQLFRHGALDAGQARLGSGPNCKSVQQGGRGWAYEIFSRNNEVKQLTYLRI